MACPYLDYRMEAGDKAFEEDRAYCVEAERFVEPLRADMCNDRYMLRHDRDCEIYLEAEE